MGKLKTVQARLRSAPANLRFAPKRADRFYQSIDWRALRAAKKAQGPAFCCECGSTGRLILDHRAERRDGGADLPSVDELDWYCTEHHNAKTGRERARRGVGGGAGQGGSGKVGRGDAS